MAPLSRRDEGAERAKKLGPRRTRLKPDAPFVDTELDDEPLSVGLPTGRQLLRRDEDPPGRPIVGRTLTDANRQHQVAATAMKASDQLRGRAFHWIVLVEQVRELVQVVTRSFLVAPHEFASMRSKIRS
jgi:hypothetical protein